MADGEFLGKRPIITHGTVTLPRTAREWPTRMKLGRAVYEVPRDLNIARLNEVFDEYVAAVKDDPSDCEDVMGFIAAFTASFMATQPARDMR